MASFSFGVLFGTTIEVRHCLLDGNGASLCAHIFDDIKLHVRERDLCVICHRLVEFK